MPSGTADLDLRGIVYEDTRLGDTDLRLVSEDRKITVETLDVRQYRDRISLKGSLDLASLLLENINLNVSIDEVAAYTRTLLPEFKTLSGAVKADLKASGPLREPTARADISFKDVRVNDLDISLAVFNLQSAGRRIDIDLADVKAAPGEVKLSGHLLRGPEDTAFDLSIADLTLFAAKTFLALEKPGQVHFTRSGAFSVKDISLSGPPGRIHLDGSVDARQKADVHLDISKFTSRGWFETLATDQIAFNGLNARIHLSGTTHTPAVSIVGDLAQLAIHKEQLTLSGRFDFSYTDNGIDIRTFYWQDGPGQIIDVKGSVPIDPLQGPLLRPGPLSLQARISIADLGAFGWLFPDYIPSDGGLQGNLALTGTWKAPTGTFTFKSSGLNDPPTKKSMPPGPIDIDGNIRIADKKLVVKSIQVQSPEVKFTSGGAWTGMPALTDILQGNAGKWAGNIDMQGKLSVDDLNWLAAENPSLRRVSGRLEADVALKGPVSDPAIDALVRISDGELRPNLDVPSLQALNLTAKVTPSGIRLQTFSGRLGGAPFQITGSVIRNSQDEMVADLRLKGDNLLFYRSAGLKVRADTDLTVKGPIKRLEAGGEVAITDGRMVQYFDFLGLLKGSPKPKVDMGLQLFSITREPLSHMVFNLRITSKNPFSIRNNLARGAVRPELKLTGTGEFPVLAGVVYIDPTRISLPAGSLTFESGVIRFDPNRPDRPTLDLIGTSKMLGYEVTMLVEGPYDEPVVTLSSVPPLPNEELLLLLLTGQPPNSGGEGQSSRQSMNVAVFLGKDLLARWFGSESSEASESIVDRFDISVGKGVSRAGEETIDAQFRLANDVLRDGDKLYITGEKDVYDFYNVGLKIVFRFR